MSDQHTVLRSMHDTGLAAWFGGSLMGVVGLNGAVAEADQPAERLHISSVGWKRWAPVNLAAIGSHLVGAAGIALTERRRVAAQKGVGAMSATKTALTAAALGVTAYSRVLGKRMERADHVPVEGTTEPDRATPPDVAATQRKQRVVQWAIPVLTGALLMLGAFAGEQQKPGSVARGIATRLGGLVPTSARRRR